MPSPRRPAPPVTAMVPGPGLAAPVIRGRWSRWIAALGLGLGLTAAGPVDAAAEARHRRGHRPTVVAARGRAEPAAARKRPRLAPPTVARVAIGPDVGRDPGRDPGRDETAGPRRASGEAGVAAAAIDAVLRGQLRTGTTAIYVVDADTGRELFSLRPDERLNPASNVKMIATAAALDLLGPDFRYRTRLLGPGADATGAIAGDVYLHGSYDPTLGVDGLDDLARQVAATGVTRITGDVVVGAVATRDGLYRSRIGLEVTAGAPGAAPHIDVQPAYDFVELRNEAVTGKRAKVKRGLTVTSAMTTRPDGRQRLVVTVRGMIGKGKRSVETVYTKERALHAAHVLRAALGRAGVEVEGDVAVRELPAYVDGLAAVGRLPVALGEHQSAALADIVAQVNKRSINWLSDRVIATAALAGADETPSIAHGVDAMYGWLDRRAGIHRADALVDTGSGLSHRTELTARQLVDVIRTAAGLTAHADGDPARIAACARAFTRSLSIGGVDGTLRARFRGGGLRGRVIGKTGTLSNAIALSGLLTTGDRRIAFSLVTNGHDPARKRTIRAGHEAVVAILDRYLAATAPAAPAAPSAPTRPDAAADAPVVAAATVDDEPARDPAATSAADADPEADDEAPADADDR